MKRLLACILALGFAEPCLAQAFAPAQPRASRFDPTKIRIAPNVGMMNDAGGSANSLTSTGFPVLYPNGLRGNGAGTMAASVLIGGANVQIPESAAGTGARMLVVPNATGGQSAILYNPLNGSIVEYQQVLQVDLTDRFRQNAGYSPYSVYNAGQGTSAGVNAGPTNVTINAAGTGFIGVDSGIPAINNLHPSYDYKSNPVVTPGGLP